jgi:hypothetical protein
LTERGMESPVDDAIERHQSLRDDEDDSGEEWPDEIPLDVDEADKAEQGRTVVPRHRITATRRKARRARQHRLTVPPVLPIGVCGDRKPGCAPTWHAAATSGKAPPVAHRGAGGLRIAGVSRCGDG